MKYRKITIAILVGIAALVVKPAVAQEATNNSGITGKEWRLKEIRFLQNNTAYHYKEDDAFESNINLGNDYLKFNNDGTGIYRMGDGTGYKLIWKYVNAEKTAIDYKIEDARYDQPVLIHWEHISVKKNEISYAEYYTNKGGTHSIGYGTRVSR